MSIHKPDINIRFATAQDMEAVHALVLELAIFEKEPEAVITNPSEYRLDGFAPDSWFECLVAEDGDEVVGAAVFYKSYSTWKGRIIYLDDLIVTEAYRRMGVGKKLLNSLVAYTREIGARQLRWHVLDWNEPAIQFYRSIKANLDSEWITCKLEEEDLKVWETLD